MLANLKAFNRCCLLFGTLLVVGCGNHVNVGNTSSDVELQSKVDEPSTKPDLPIVQPLENVGGMNVEDPKSQSASEGPFRFPSDTGGQILSNVLPPSPPRVVSDSMQEPKPRTIPSNIIEPSLLTPFKPPVLPLPNPAPQPIRPWPLREQMPTGSLLTMPALPERAELALSSLTKIPTSDLAKPVNLPILAQPTFERPSLEDPTIDFSASNVIGAPLPLRNTPAPFVKINLPDPFENAQTIKLPTPMPESQTVLSAPLPPRP
jgi:hypothetical protein